MKPSDFTFQWASRSGIHRAHVATATAHARAVDVGRMASRELGLVVKLGLHIRLGLVLGLTLPKTSTITVTHKIRYLESRTGEISGSKKKTRPGRVDAQSHSQCRVTT